MKFKVNNKEVFASTGGRPFDKKKPLIIFIHGSGLSHITWVLQTRYFAFHGYSILAIDLPGHGYSEGPALESIEEQGKWISDVIDSVEMKEASLVGHSQGCLIVLECASQFPEKVKSIGLMGGAGAIPMNPELLDLAEKGDPKAVDLMMDWAHGPGGHFGGHPVPGLNHINLGALKPFELVILQGGSGEANTISERKDFSLKAKEMIEKIHEAGAEAALYMIHAYVEPHENTNPEMIENIKLSLIHI